MFSCTKNNFRFIVLFNFRYGFLRVIPIVNNGLKKFLIASHVVFLGQRLKHSENVIILYCLVRYLLSLFFVICLLIYDLCINFVLTSYNKFVTQGSNPVELVPTNDEKLNPSFVRSTAYFGHVANVADDSDDAIPQLSEVPFEVHC